jgi:hypothetical protein
MPMSARDLVQTGQLTLRNPREAARVVMGWPLSLGELWSVLALTAVISALVAQFVVAQSPQDVDPVLGLMLSSPLSFALIQFIGLGILVLLTYGVGRQFGGTGSFAGTLALIGWLQVILMVLQLAQVAALVLLPPLALMISLFSVVLFAWLLTSFTAELHGFTSLIRTFSGMVASFIGLSVLLALFLVLVLGLES